MCQENNSWKCLYRTRFIKSCKIKFVLEIFCLFVFEEMKSEYTCRQSGIKDLGHGGGGQKAFSVTPRGDKWTLPPVKCGPLDRTRNWPTQPPAKPFRNPIVSHHLSRESLPVDARVDGNEMTTKFNVEYARLLLSKCVWLINN
jgi:hypothetical protein